MRGSAFIPREYNARLATGVGPRLVPSRRRRGARNRVPAGLAMSASDPDDIVGEIQRLQNLLDEVQARLSSLASEPSGREDGRGDLLAQATVDEPYAQLEIAKRIPSADAWKAIQNATSAVGRLASAGGGASISPYAGPLVRLTLFVSRSGPRLGAG